MDFDDAKENIQPLAQGRNASILQASLKIDSPQELLAQRKELEKEIHNYTGDDPLSAWYNYIEWIEQSFPSGGKESGLQEVLSKCLSKFESDERYKQDRRMIKLYIKFIDSYKDPAECYQQLFNAGIGTMVADFYIAWAYCYDLVGNTRKADEVFRRGIACRAQPLEDLQEAHQHFGFSVAQRLMYKDDDSVKEETNRQLQERRLALTSLRGHRRKQMVGTIRTGAAVKSFTPGTVKIDQPSTSSQRGNARVQVFKDENENPNGITIPTTEPPPEEEKSVVRSIIDAARNQENEKEPGPWNKAHSRKKGKIFGKTTITNELGFEIHEDEDQHDEEDVKKPCVPPIPIKENEIRFNKPFIYPANFCAKSKPIKGWVTPVTTEEMPDKNTIPQYNKCKLYPRPNVEFQVEELKAYYILKKRGTENAFTKERDIYWGCGPKYSIRLYPHFAKQSKPQKLEAIDEPYFPDFLPGLKVPFDEIYNKEEKVERQYEELLALRIKRNDTIIKATDMEETMCVTSEKVQRRKSFYPLRKSLATAAFRGPNRMSTMPEQSEEDEQSTTNELCGPLVLMGVKTVQEEKSCSFKGNNEAATTSVKEVPLIAKILHSKEQTAKETECKIQTVKGTGKTLTETDAASKPFEIFKDESSIEVANSKPPVLEPKLNLAADEDFQFKTPALPIANSTTVAVATSKNLQFEIFDDENLAKNSPNSMPKPDFGIGNGGFFDPEETCSTQTFNIFLKAQSVSTPKAVTKSQPQRQFGNILKEVTPAPIPEQKDEQSLNSSIENQNYPAGAAPVVIYSPPRQQLSTILETSEHGTTQGTHTTGATTKSTLSSPEFDIDSRMPCTPGINQPQIAPVLETVKELSCETSNVISPIQSVDNMMTSLKIQSGNNSAKPQSENLATPGPTRLQKKNVMSGVGGSGGGGLDFSIFEDSMEKNQKQVGNFSRLEEKEDTAAGSAFRAMPPIRFQDDKTETIPKMHLIQQQLKFQEDKTETISKMLFAPSAPIQFQEDKTETITKMLLAPPQPVKFPEEKTETISKFMLKPPEPLKFEDDKVDSQIVNNEKNQPEPMNQDDSFEFFGHSPPKATKQLATKQITQVRTAADTRTPLTFDSKRFCDKDTPVTQKTKSISNPIALFEDELQQPHAKSLNKPTTNVKNNLKDSFLPDFSLIEDSQPAQTNKAKPTKSKSVFRDSFIPDFSIIEDSQPQAEQKPTTTNQHKTKNESILPEFSLIENTQPKQGGKSLLKDVSHVPETQPDESVIISSQPIEPRFLKQNSMKTALQTSFQKDFSKNNSTENKVEEQMHWKQTANPKAVANRTQEGTTLKNILMDTFMKDFSEINEPPPIPNDIKEITMVQPSKNNSTLKFLNESIKQKEENNKNSNKSNTKISNISNSCKETKLSFLAPAPPEIKRSSTDDDDKYFELNCETEMFGTNISMIKNSTWLPNHGPSFSKGNAKQLSQIQEQSIHIKDEEMSAHSSSTLKATQQQQQEYRTQDLTKSKLGFIDKSLGNDFSIEVSASELAAIKAKKIPKHTDQEQPVVIIESPEHIDATAADDDCEMSIYYKNTPKTPKPQKHVWDDADAFKTPANNHYVHAETDLNQTHQVIENMCIDPNVNPFNVDLINAFLEQHYVISYLESLPTCKLVGSIQRLKQHTSIDINGVQFDVLKLIGEGAYGAVFCGKETTSGKLVAMKQEKPPNYWEYYICLEIQERIRIDEMLTAYMSVDYALIGNNSSILISNFSNYGSLITVCNKIKKHTMKNVDEYVVMLLASELLEIMDHLHAVNIIHADVKADNFLLMNKLSYPPTQRCLQLIDFGVSIDMKLFKQGQTFSFIHNDNAFKCPEMREERPWTYQLDLYGLAGVLHVLLFGKYMDIEKKARGFWMHKTHVPRYINRSLWDDIFRTLLNIRDCNSMPNLQDLRAALKKELEEKDKYVVKMVNEFNRALTN
ncbi:Mitotic checkpoint serine/threonine-protein kinase BUB1 [Lucilia cuprina]|nr:Mitotic checkpoint serine/threonine-protein kinase BUB1 [Lucilia cuprina]